MGVPREVGVRNSKAEKKQTAWASGSQAQTFGHAVVDACLSVEWSWPSPL